MQTRTFVLTTSCKCELHRNVQTTQTSSQTYEANASKRSNRNSKHATENSTHYGRTHNDRTSTMQRLQSSSQTRRTTHHRMPLRLGRANLGRTKPSRQTDPLLTSRPDHHRANRMTLPGLSRLNPCACKQPQPTQPWCGDRGVEEDE